MENRILCPLDGSKLSEAVTPYVSQICAGLKGSVTLFHVEPPTGALDGALGPAYLQGMA